MIARRQREERKRRPPRPWIEVLRGIWDQIKDDLLLVILATMAALLRAMGTTIRSGQTGLSFLCGHARRELQPGFHLLVPFLHRVRRMPTRSRTLDLPSQRVATLQGLVYHVDANLVYRVVDVRRAMIQVDELEKGMIQMLGLGVQEVLRGSHAEEIRTSRVLDRALAENLARRLEVWGVSVERAGFPSITPSPQSLRITQLEQVTGERRTTYGRLVEAGVPERRALALVGTRSMPRGKTRAHRRLARYRRRLHKLNGLLKQRGWSAVEIKQAGLSLRTRIISRGRR